MAFCNRIGNLVKQSISRHVCGPAPVMPMLNAVRGVSTTKLFIGGLSYGTDDQSLREAFSSFGDVVEARVITDRESGRSKGFGFVNFASDESAITALSSMDGQDLQGRNIRVSYANDRPSGGGYRGGFGGGGNDFGGDSGRGGY